MDTNDVKKINFKIEYIFGIIEIIIFFLQGIYGTVLPTIGVTIIVLYILSKILSNQPIKLINNKIDTVVVLLATTAFLPLITNQYISLSGTISRILNFINVLGIYFIFKDLFKMEKIQKVFSKSLVIFIAVMILIGIVQLCTNHTDLISRVLLLRKNGENRLSSVFGSPNTLSPLIASIFFINLILIIYEKNITKKSFYESINFIFISGIILTYCKMIFVIFPVMLLFFLFIYRKYIKGISVPLIFSLVISFVFVILFEKLFEVKKYIEIGIILALFFIAVYLFNILYNKNKLNFKSKKIKGIAIVSIIICSTIGIIYSINSNNEFVVFSSELEKNYNSKTIDNILPNQNYNFKFDIFSNTENEFTINIIEKDSKNKVIEEHRTKIENYDGIKNIEILTSANTNEVKIEFYSNNVSENNSLIIREFYLNDKKINLDYDILPTKLVNKIKNINFKYKTLTERFVMIGNSLKLSIPNILTGLGGEAWRYKHQEVIEYEYNSNYLNSYPFQLLLEFGIISFVLYAILVILIIYYLIKFAIKDKKKHIQFVGIGMALLVIVFHTILDIDLENKFVFTYFYILIAMLSNNIIEIEKENKIRKYISNVILIVCLLISIFISLTYRSSFNIVKYLELANGLDINSKEYQSISTLLYYENKKYIEYERYNYLEKYYDIIKYAVYSNISDKREIIDEYIQKIEKYENKELYNEESIMKKIQISKDIIEILEKNNYDRSYDLEIDKLENIIIESYDTTIEQLQNYYKVTYRTSNNSLKVITQIKEECESKIDNKEKLFVR